MPKVADSPTAVLIIRTISSQPIQNEETDDFIHRQYATKLTRRYSPRTKQIDGGCQGAELTFVAAIEK